MKKSIVLILLVHQSSNFTMQSVNSASLQERLLTQDQRGPSATRISAIAPAQTQEYSVAVNITEPGLPTKISLAEKIKLMAKHPGSLTALELMLLSGSLMACIQYAPPLATTSVLVALADSVNFHTYNTGWLKKTLPMAAIGLGLYELDTKVLLHLGFETGWGAVAIASVVAFTALELRKINPVSLSRHIHGKKMQHCSRSPHAMETGMVDRDPRDLEREIEEVIASDEYKALVAQLEEYRAEKFAQTTEIQDLRSQVSDLAAKFATFHTAARPASLDSDEGSEDSLNSTIPLAESPEHLAPATLDGFVDGDADAASAAGVMSLR